MNVARFPEADMAREPNEARDRGQIVTVECWHCERAIYLPPEDAHRRNDDLICVDCEEEVGDHRDFFENLVDAAQEAY